MYILSWNIDLEQTVIKISKSLLNFNEWIELFRNNKQRLIEEKRLHDLNDNLFSELLTVSNFSLKRVTSRVGEDLYFKIENSKAILDIVTNFDLSKISKIKTKKSYRIVSSQREPFLESIDYDVCVNGMKCFNTFSLCYQCCKGFVTELLQKIAYDLDFEVELFLTAENMAFDKVLSNEMHMAALPFKISKNYSNSIEYSNMFLYSGYGILVQKISKKFETFLFLKPFTHLHWLLIICISITSSICLSCLEFNSPFG